MSGFGTGIQGGYEITWKHIESVDQPAAPAENTGARYLPSGQLIEWELDANGKPMRITVDGESVPAEFLSGAKRVTINETVHYDKKKGSMCFFYDAVDESGEKVDTYIDELDVVHLRGDQREAFRRYQTVRNASFGQAKKNVLAKFPGTKIEGTRLDPAAEDELRRCVAEGASGAAPQYSHPSGSQFAIYDDVETKSPSKFSKKTLDCLAEIMNTDEIKPPRMLSDAQIQNALNSLNVKWPKGKRAF